MALEKLATLIAGGMPTDADRERLAEQTRDAIDGLFGSRYPARSGYARRVVFGGRDAAPFAGLLHEDSPDSGVYGGMSMVWFPVAASDQGPPTSLLTLVCGTRGLAPDEPILGRPGHARYLQALRRHLRHTVGASLWVKHDPANFGELFPRVLRDRFARFRDVLDRYGSYIYAAVPVPEDAEKASAVVKALLDMYAWERGWIPLKQAAAEVESLLRGIRANLFPKVGLSELSALVRERRLEILQGPPGTGKTRLASSLLHRHFRGRGMTVQFHPAVTYEGFIAGIAPDVSNESLRFAVRPGWLVEAVAEADVGDFLFVVDEINRGDLGRVLGEAIHLFEPREIAQGRGRRIRLPLPLANGQDSLTLPPGLFVLGTMNSADRSIAILDLAVRRRFAFVDMWPDLTAVAEQGLEFATDAFSRLLDIFAQYATDETLVLMPGHAYFLADSEGELARRLRYELMPLLLEYLQEGRIAAFAGELRAYLDWLDTEIGARGNVG